MECTCGRAGPNSYQRSDETRPHEWEMNRDGRDCRDEQVEWMMSLEEEESEGEGGR